MSLVIPEIFIDTDLESKWSELNIYEQKKYTNSSENLKLTSIQGNTNHYQSYQSY